MTLATVARRARKVCEGDLKARQRGITLQRGMRRIRNDHRRICG